MSNYIEHILKDLLTMKQNIKTQNTGSKELITLTTAILIIRKIFQLFTCNYIFKT